MPKSLSPRIPPTSSPGGGFPLDHLSASSLTLFKRCPRQWQAQYLFDAPRTANAALIIGTAVHSYLNFALAGPEFSFDSIWREAVEEADIKTGGNIDWSRMSQEKAKEQARTHVDNYLRLVAPLLGEVVTTEQELNVWIPGVEIPILGYIDLETTTKIIDYKTTGYFNRKPSLNPEWAYQLAVYQLKVPKAGEIHVLTRGDKYPVYVPNSFSDPLHRPYDSVLCARMERTIKQTYDLMLFYWAKYGLKEAWPGNETQEWGHKYCNHVDCCAMEKW